MKISKSFKPLVAAVGLASGVFAAGAVNAALFYPGQLNQIDDEDAERWIDMNNNGILDEGDRLRGILQIDFIESTLTGDKAYYGYPQSTELTGIFDVQVTSFVDLGNGTGNYQFGAYADFASEISGITGVAASDLSGLMVAFFTESTANPDDRFNYNEAGMTFAEAEATATGGDFRLGIGDVVGEDFWSATNSFTNPGLAATLPLDTSLGQFSWGLSIIYNNTGNVFDQVVTLSGETGGIVDVDIAGNGDIFSSGIGYDESDGPYDIWSNFQGKVNVVPEPATLALFGTALLGLGGFSRRRRKA